MDLSAVIPHLILADGRTLEQVEIRSFGSKSVMVRHRDGVLQIPYDQFPAELRPALLAKRPAPTTPSAARPATAPARQAATAPAQKRLPATSSKTATATETISGRVVWQEGSRATPLGGVAVLLCDARTFAVFDRDRRGRFDAEHEQLRRKLAGEPSLPNPSKEQIQKFFEEEFLSWENMPQPLAAAQADAKGQFALQKPVGVPTLLFIRIKVQTGAGTAGHVWAVRADSPSVLISNNNAYPALAAEVPSFE
ncbi:hypothetical protein DB347_16240 [Opitutaceae bacterium EW11]|nr:hypothetical protein DB347_16240 [Opitutaceae bacterium EW11]